MTQVQTRRTDRISLEINILASGTDAAGIGFQETARTLSISRYGAKIAISQELAAGHELRIRNIASGAEADFRVVGRTGEGPEERYYGVECLDSGVNLWGIYFPPISEAEAAVGRVLLECVTCHNQQLAYLNELELEVFEASHVISRPCDRCVGDSPWKRPSDDASALPAPPSLQGMPSFQPLSLTPERRQDERRSARINLRLKACICTKEHGEDVVITENVSRGGFCCKSTERYGVGAIVVEVCVPYSSGPGSIFSLARIIRVKPLPSEASYSYGIAHLHMDKRSAEN